MNSFFHKNHRLVFYAAWLVLGLVQSGLTELQDDEAYYWVYSKYLDFGYFDHPPMIAVLIKMGYAIFPNELGVRLFPLLLNVCSLFIIEKLLVNKNPFLFYAIAVSIAALQLAGFTAVPDIPLIFFTALFFLCYKKFLENQSAKNILLIGISIALLFYTKYHAVLIVFFALLSNIKLLAKPHIYIAGLIALVLFSPHLNWQWEHNWVSFRYHLFESNVNDYKFSFTANYLLSQVLLAGPIAGFILLPAAFLFTSASQTEKALKWTMIGIYTFFLLSSLRGKVEVNWTSPALVPLIILSHRYLNEKLALRKWLFRLLPITLVLVVFVRVIMIEDILPTDTVKKRYHAWKEWPQKMKETTKRLPVVFSNSYQRASKYWFYSGQMTYSQNHVRDHRNNYNFWPIEDSLFNKPVYFFDIYGLSRFPDSLKTPIGYIGYRYDSAFISFAKVIFEIEHTSYSVKRDRAFILKGWTRIPEDYSMYIFKHKSLDPAIKLFVFNKRDIIKEIAFPVTLQKINSNGFTVEINPQLPPGKYYFYFSIEIPDYNPTHNSEKIELIVE
jgi:hypothetical protein